MPLPSSGPLSINDIAGEFGGSTPHAMSEYYAGGGLVPAGTSGTYGAVPSSGTISIQNFYGTSNYIPVYIEEIFSTWLYTGAGGTQTITNGINLTGSGGLVWVKSRSLSSDNPFADTARGGGNIIYSNSTAAQSGPGINDITGFTSTGFTIGNNANVNQNGQTYVSWTFRKQPKFFDVVTYTGDGTGTRAISHALTSTPGLIIVKRTDTTGTWKTFWTNGGAVLDFNSSAATPGAAGNGYVGGANATTFTVYQSIDTSSVTDVNASGGTYVAYIFGNNSGGFGPTGVDNVITCGLFSDDGSGTNLDVTLGYEPQLVLVKSVVNAGNWQLADSMRGFVASPATTTSVLRPNSTNAESTWNIVWGPTSTGFQWQQNSGAGIHVYMAIRRGPMKTPTTGTSVFSPFQYNGGGSGGTTTLTTNFPVDMLWASETQFNGDRMDLDRLRGVNRRLRINSTNVEDSGTYQPSASFQSNTTVSVTGILNSTGRYGAWAFRRAPGFFDEVCYTGNGANRTLSHNLGAVPEMMIVKARTGFESWITYHSSLGNTRAVTLNNDQAPITASQFWNNTTPTSSVFTVSTADGVNSSSYTFVAYLFATVAGVSKVGSYTGTGALQTVNCGFTGGTRFVLIKRTDSAGDWWLYDSARGISSSDDPYLILNSSASETTGTNYVDTTSVGFQVTAAAPAGLNANGGTYIFLAIA
jgi:hypothetical protein